MDSGKFEFTPANVTGRDVSDDARSYPRRARTRPVLFRSPDTPLRERESDPYVTLRKLECWNVAEFQRDDDARLCRVNAIFAVFLSKGIVGENRADKRPLSGFNGDPLDEWRLKGDGPVQLPRGGGRSKRARARVSGGDSSLDPALLSEAFLLPGRDDGRGHP